MIRSFTGRETELVWLGRWSRRLQPDIQQTARRELRHVDAVLQPLELRQPPGNRFEHLKGFDPQR
jgi:proteic killer suppression protein